MELLCHKLSLAAMSASAPEDTAWLVTFAYQRYHFFNCDGSEGGQRLGDTPTADGQLWVGGG